MAVPTLTQFLDNLYTTTWQNRMEGVADNVFNATPFWFWLKDKGKLRPQRGGRFIEENLEYATNNNVQWVDKGSVVPLNDYEFLTIAQFQWRYLSVNIVRFGVDEQKNAGKAKIMSLMNAKLDNSEASLITEFETRLTDGPGTISSGTTTYQAQAFDGLNCLVADDPTSNLGGNGIAVGAIDSSQATYSWWRNQTINMTGISFNTGGVARMRTILNNCMNNRREDRPDIILTDQHTYENYEATVLPYYRAINRKLGDASFENQTFKNIPMVWTPSIPGEASASPVAGHMYFLNTSFLSLIYDPASWFDMTEWKAIPDQINDRVAQIICSCAFTTNRRRVHGVIYGLNTD